MEKPELDALSEILRVECPETRARLMRESGLVMYDGMNARLMAGSGDDAAINRAIVGGR